MENEISLKTPFESVKSFVGERCEIISSVTTFNDLYSAYEQWMDGKAIPCRRIHFGRYLFLMKFVPTRKKVNGIFVRAFQGIRLCR